MIYKYKVRQMEATFWRNLSSKTLPLNIWLLLLTTTGYFTYYTYTTSSTTIEL